LKCYISISLINAGIFRSNITLRPIPFQSEASATVKKVKAEEDKKGKMKERHKFEINKEAEGRRVKAKVEVKDAKVKISHAHVDGLYEVKIKSFLSHSYRFRSLFFRTLSRLMKDFSTGLLRTPHVRSLCDN
jgi:hypothetical protein